MGKKTEPARHAARDGGPLTLCGRPLWRTRIALPGDEPTCANCRRIQQFERRFRRRPRAAGGA